MLFSTAVSNSGAIMCTMLDKNYVEGEQYESLPQKIVFAKKICRKFCSLDHEYSGGLSGISGYISGCETQVTSLLSEPLYLVYKSK